MTRTVPLKIPRPSWGPTFSPSQLVDMPVAGLPGWRSNGGPTRGHPARAFPNSLESPLPFPGGHVRLHIIGVLAQFAGSDYEVPGTLGASIQLLNQDQIVYRQELVNGRHYSDAGDLEPIDRVLGDGSSLKTLGSVILDEDRWRVDLLTIDLPPDREADSFKFKALSSPASFTVFDVFLEAEAPHGCPFHSGGGGVPLARIGAIVRSGNRVEFAKAVSQLEESIAATTDLDEARGQILTFLAVVSASMLEMGGGRELLRQQLESARELDRADRSAALREIALRRIETIAQPLFRQNSNPSDELVDRALAWVERNYAKPISDSSVARELGLSTSHFRFLFRQATGQPFHKYLIAIRLEKAKQMLLDPRSSVGSVARAVGFTALAHFSRAFTNRFSVSPNQMRRCAP